MRSNYNESTQLLDRILALADELKKEEAEAKVNEEMEREKGVPRLLRPKRRDAIDEINRILEILYLYGYKDGVVDSHGRCD